MQVRAELAAVGRVFHALASLSLVLAALLAFVATVLSVLGVLPWLSLSPGSSEAEYSQAGVVAQIGLTTLLGLLVAFIPGNYRMLALEQSHRNFRMTMTDVAKAYHAAHVADRKGAFTLPSEFDQVRERIDYLRSHPDLRLLEADVLTLAAQMSQQSHRLAQLYSENNVTRARDFLAQRQQEAQDQKARIGEALQVCREILRWTSQVELEEVEVANQLQELEQQLQTAMPALGLRLDGTRVRKAASDQAVGRADNLVVMPIMAPELAPVSAGHFGIAMEA